MKSSHSPLSPAMSRGAEGRKSVCVYLCVLAANTVIKRCQRRDHHRRRVPLRAVEILKKASESVSHQVFMASPRRHTHTPHTHKPIYITYTAYFLQHLCSSTSCSTPNKSLPVPNHPSKTHQRTTAASRLHF